jgi:hypothetical protein
VDHQCGNEEEEAPSKSLWRSEALTCDSIWAFKQEFGTVCVSGLRIVALRSERSWEATSYEARATFRLRGKMNEASGSASALFDAVRR